MTFLNFYLFAFHSRSPVISYVSFQFTATLTVGLGAGSPKILRMNLTGLFIAVARAVIQPQDQLVASQEMVR